MNDTVSDAEGRQLENKHRQKEKKKEHENSNNTGNTK